MTIDTFLITCEHGGNRIPAPYRRLFRGQRALLDSHRGYDPGALVMARALAVVVRRAAGGLDHQPPAGRPQPLDRSPATLLDGDPRGAGGRARADRRAALPARTACGSKRLVAQAVARGGASSTFRRTASPPELDGNVRRADVGLLYDPGRRGEVELCARWKTSLAGPALRSCGCAATTRTRARRRADLAPAPPLRSAAYVGIELEINQRIVLAGGRPWTALRAASIVATAARCIRRQSLPGRSLFHRVPPTARPA